MAIASAELFLPVKIGNFTDFFASVFHATNTGSMFRPDNPLLPNYKHVPIAYHGRAPGRCGQERHRRCGGRRPDFKRGEETVPALYRLARSLDYEPRARLLHRCEPSALGDPGS